MKLQHRYSHYIIVINLTKEPIDLKAMNEQINNLKGVSSAYPCYEVKNDVMTIFININASFDNEETKVAIKEIVEKYEKV